MWYPRRLPGRRSVHLMRYQPEKLLCQLLSSSRREYRNSHDCRCRQQPYGHQSFWKTDVVYLWQKQYLRLCQRGNAGVSVSGLPDASMHPRTVCLRLKKPAGLYRCNYPVQRSFQSAWKSRPHQFCEPHASVQNRLPRHTGHLHHISGRWCSGCRKCIS